jgi:maltose-binding protein MalE
VKELYQSNFNKGKVKNHFQYDKWKYILGILLVIFSWSMLSTVTAPRTPADKKVDIFLVGGYMMLDESTDYANTILDEFPELMEVNFLNITLGDEMEYASRQRLMVMIGSQTGDIYSFTEDEFQAMAELGIFIPLDNYPELLDHFTEEELEAGTFTTEDDPTPRIYGVPITGVEPMHNSFFNTEKSLMGVTAYSQNSEKAVEVLQWIIEHRETEQYEQRKLELQKLKEQQELENQDN